MLATIKILIIQEEYTMSTPKLIWFPGAPNSSKMINQVYLYRYKNVQKCQYYTYGGVFIEIIYRRSK